MIFRLQQQSLMDNAMNFPPVLKILLIWNQQTYFHIVMHIYEKYINKFLSFFLENRMYKKIHQR